MCVHVYEYSCIYLYTYVDAYRGNFSMVSHVSHGISWLRQCWTAQQPITLQTYQCSNRIDFGTMKSPMIFHFEPWWAAARKVEEMHAASYVHHIDIPTAVLFHDANIVCEQMPVRRYVFFFTWEVTTSIQADTTPSLSLQFLQVLPPVLHQNFDWKTIAYQYWCQCNYWMPMEWRMDL